MRIALVALALLAIVLPTALLPETASAQGRFTVQHVLRVFKADGLPLHRTANGSSAAPYETFASSHPHFAVYVLPTASSHDFIYVSNGSAPLVLPQFLHRRNVIVIWTPRPSSYGARILIHSALGSLSDSPSDAKRRPPPRIVLNPDQTETIEVASIGTQVGCVNGSADANTVIHPADHASRTSAHTEGNEVAILRWRPVGNAGFSVACRDATPPSGQDVRR